MKPLIPLSFFCMLFAPQVVFSQGKMTLPKIILKGVTADAPVQLGKDFFIKGLDKNTIRIGGEMAVPSHKAVPFSAQMSTLATSHPPMVTLPAELSAFNSSKIPASLPNSLEMEIAVSTGLKTAKIQEMYSRQLEALRKAKAFIAKHGRFPRSYIERRGQTVNENISASEREEVALGLDITGTLYHPFLTDIIFTPASEELLALKVEMFVKHKGYFPPEKNLLHSQIKEVIKKASPEFVQKINHLKEFKKTGFWFPCLPKENGFLAETPAEILAEVEAWIAQNGWFPRETILLSGAVLETDLLTDKEFAERSMAIRLNHILKNPQFAQTPEGKQISLLSKRYSNWEMIQEAKEVVADVRKWIDLYGQFPRESIFEGGRKVYSEDMTTIEKKEVSLAKDAQRIIETIGYESLEPYIKTLKNLWEDFGVPFISTLEEDVLADLKIFVAVEGRFPRKDIELDTPEAMEEVALRKRVDMFPSSSKIYDIKREYLYVQNRQPLEPNQLLTDVQAFLQEHGHWPRYEVSVNRKYVSITELSAEQQQEVRLARRALMFLNTFPDQTHPVYVTFKQLKESYLPTIPRTELTPSIVLDELKFFLQTHEYVWPSSSIMENGEILSVMEMSPEKRFEKKLYNRIYLVVKQAGENPTDPYVLEILKLKNLYGSKGKK